MCPNCNGLVELNILSPTTWELVPGYPFLITQEDFYKDETFNGYTKSILIAYANNKIKYKELKAFIELGSYKEIPVRTVCPKCNTTFETFRLCYYGTIAIEYDKLIEDFFLQAFKELYCADGTFLYENSDDIPYLIQLFFKKTDKNVKHLYRLLSIHNDIPYERGGDGGELVDFAIKNIALGLFSSFLYQMFLQDITEKIKDRIKEKYKDINKKNSQKEILRQLKKYMRNEHVEWNEETAIELVQAEVDNLIEKYIEALY